MKKIGILGGMGPEATVELYLRLIRIYQKDFGAVYDDDFPEIVIINLPLPYDLENPNGREEMKEILIKGVKKLEKAEVDFIAIPCNTVTFFIEEMQKEVSIPILNILEETAKEVKSSNLSKVGLLGTELTIEQEIYNKVLQDVELVTLSRDQQKKTTRAIINILAGECIDFDLISFQIEELKRQGIDKVILGCTELPLICRNREDVFDTINILARAIVREAND